MNPKGFTLVELLVVIALIGILSVIGFSTYSNVQKNAKDTARKADIDAIAQAYEDKYNALSAIYSPISGPQFVKGIVPTAPPGTSPYAYTDGPDASTPNPSAYKICTVLEAGGSYCRSNQQGPTSTVAFVAPTPPPPPPPPVASCFTIANGGAAGNAAANTSWVAFWDSLPATASLITLSANAGVKSFATTSGANAQSMLTGMKNRTFFSIVDGSNLWAGARNNSITGCGSSLSFGIAGSGNTTGCTCDANVLVAPGLSTAKVLCTGLCNATCTGQTQVCVTP